MAESLENLYCGRLTVQELIKQLSEINISKDGKYLIEFVPFFLNYIRDSCSWILDGSKNTTFVNQSFVNEVQILDKLETTPDGKKGAEYVRDQNINPDNSSDGSTAVHRSNRRKGKRNSITRIEPINVTKAVLPPNINDMQAFPPIGSELPINKPPVRRINPTHIKKDKTFIQSPVSGSSDIKSSSVFELSPLQEKDDVTLQRERVLLKEARDKLTYIGSAKVSNVHMQERPKSENTLKPVNIDSLTPIVPEPSLVTKNEELSILIELYNEFLSKGFVPNMTSELYFIFQLITAPMKTKEFSVENKTPFCSVHNCIYFGTSVLKLQQQVLFLLDNRTLKSLADIPVMRTFSPELVQILTEFTQHRRIPQRKIESNIAEVAYCADTDTRKNFPTNQSFTSFSKQRDLFYEILYAWQENSGLNDPHFDRWFTKNIRYLLEMSSDVVNYFHLAKLMCSQMLISCLNGCELNEIPVLYHNAGSRDKLAKLNERLSAQKGNPCPLPDFPGMQGFFEAFLKNSSSSFSRHLADVLKCQLMEINSSDFHLETQSCSIEEIREKLYSMLMESRLLAKFLAFIAFMPYKSLKPLSKPIVEELVKFRVGMKAELDCVRILDVAAEKGQLILTVPWVVEYISMTDQVGRLLEETAKVYSQLVAIYHGECKQFMTEHNFIFLRIVIGWLFENQNIPNVFYGSKPKTSVFSFPKTCNDHSLDMQDIIDINILYTCCPYLQELRCLVEDFINCVPRKAPVRKITPLPMSQSSVVLSDEAKLESDLQEYFYFLQPKVMKKIVEFTAERTACNFIHKINLELDALKIRYARNISDELLNLENMADGKQVQSAIGIGCENLCKEVKTWSLDLVYKDCFKAVKQAFITLAGDQFDSVAVETGCKLSSRLALERSISWIDSSITADNLKNDLRNQTTKLLKKKRQCSWSCGDFPLDDDWDGPSSTYFLKSLHKILLIIKSEKTAFSLLELTNILQQLICALELKYFSDFLKVMVLLTVNITIAIIVHLPDQCTDDFVSVAMKLWQRCPPSLIDIRQFLCSSNVHYIHYSKSIELSWQKLSLVVNSLLENKLVTEECVNNCVSGLKNCFNMKLPLCL